jgi:uncharacterized protein
MTPLAVELTAPALFVAGASTSLHCALMCGAINAAQMRSAGALPLREALLLVHGARVLGYALLGALAGALGGALALQLPDPVAGTGLQMLAALALVVAGAQQLRGVRPARPAGPHGAPCAARLATAPPSPAAAPARLRLLAQGLLWSLMPCGILYTALLLAALTTSPLMGFALLAAFGLGTLPLMGVSGGLLGLVARPRHPLALRRLTGALLIGLGTAALAALALADTVLPAWLCSPLAAWGPGPG